MDANAKNSIRQSLVLTMEQTRGERIESGSRLLGQILIFNRRVPMPVLGILMALMLGTGTAFAAESSLPGEPLYPVKIHVNEELREALAVRAEQKAQWELERAHRRAAEALKAQERGKLDEAMRERMVERMREYEAKTETITEKLEAQGNLNAAAHLRERMENYLETKVEVFEQVEISEEELQAARERRAQYQAELERRRALLEAQAEQEQADLLERRHEILKEQEELKEDLLERRREILEQEQQQLEAQIERRHETLQEQQEQQQDQLDRRHEFLERLKEILRIERSESEVEVEAETEVEVEAEAEIEANATIEAEVNTTANVGTSLLP